MKLNTCSESIRMHIYGSLCIDGCVYFDGLQGGAGIVLWMRPTTERRRYIVTTFLIGWALRDDVTMKSRLTLAGRIHKTIPGYVMSYSIVVVVNFISDRQYKNKDNLLTKQDTTLVIAVRGHQRSPWAHRAGGLNQFNWLRSYAEWFLMI